MNTRRTLVDVLRSRRSSTELTVGYYNRSARDFALSSFETVLGRSAATAERLIENNITSGRIVMIAAVKPQGLWEGYLGAVLAGAVPILIPMQASLHSRHDVDRKLRSAEERLPDAGLLIQASGDGEPTVDPGDRPWVAWTEDGRIGDVDGLLDNLSPSPDDPLHLQFTSGSTGDFKPVVLTHQNLISAIASIVERLQLRPEDHLVSWLPLYHDMGLVGQALTALIGGAHQRQLSPFDFLSDPTHLLTAVASSPGAISGSPNFALDYVTRRAKLSPDQELDLSTWKGCYCGSEPVDSSTIAAFIDRFEPYGLRPEVVQPTYGLAEATLMVSMPHVGERAKQVAVAASTISTSGTIEILSEGPMAGFVADDDARVTSVACLGTPAVDLTVQIMSKDGEILEDENVCGEVVVLGGAVSPGYLRADGSLDSSDGICRTGDIGFLYNSELYLIERARNIIIRNGRNYSAAAFERFLAQQLGVPLDRCAVIQEVLQDSTVVAVVESTRDMSVDDVVAAVNNTLRHVELPIDEVLVVGRNNVPRTTSGKKQHAELRRSLRNGEIKIVQRVSLGSVAEPADDPVIDLREQPVRSQILSIIERFARRRGWNGPELDESLHLQNDLGLDSLALIEMAVDIETATGSPIAEDQLGQFVTVSDVVRSALESDGLSAGVSWAVNHLVTRIPQVYREVEEQQGRQVRIEDRWYTDFGSLNYLGLDLHPQVTAAVGPMIERWGTHPSWSRAVASPKPYASLEAGLSRSVEAPDVMVFSTVTLAHIGLLPLLATRADTIIVDRVAHNSLVEGAELAAGRGAELRRFDHSDLATLEAALDGHRGRPVVVVDGVYSMTGTVADLSTIGAMTAEHGGLVYIDDAHGFGMLGKDPDSKNPYGFGGGGVVAHLGLDPRHTVYVAGMSKAYSSMAAFVTCIDDEQRALFERASTSIHSGPIPVASLATALAGLEVNAAEGDQLRSHLHDLTKQLIEGASDLGFSIDNPLSFPVVNLLIGDVARTVKASEIMWEHQMLFTPSVFPVVGLDEGGFRISLTATHTRSDIEHLLEALGVVVEEVGLTAAELAR